MAKQVMLRMRPIEYSALRLIVIEYRVKQQCGENPEWIDLASEQSCTLDDLLALLLTKVEVQDEGCVGQRVEGR